MDAEAKFHPVGEFKARFPTVAKCRKKTPMVARDFTAAWPIAATSASVFLRQLRRPRVCE
jgi:hypothetical protein